MSVTLGCIPLPILASLPFLPCPPPHTLKTQNSPSVSTRAWGQKRKPGGEIRSVSQPRPVRNQRGAGLARKGWGVLAEGEKGEKGKKERRKERKKERKERRKKRHIVKWLQTLSSLSSPKYDKSKPPKEICFPNY